MGRVGSWLVLWLCLVACGCTTIPAGVPDWLVDEVIAQAAADKKPSLAPLNPEVVLREIPRETPLAQARAIMERHGFTCWSGVGDSRGSCLHCTAYKRGPQGSADRVVVKIFDDHQRVVDVEVTVEYHVWGFFVKPRPSSPGS